MTKKSSTKKRVNPIYNKAFDEEKMLVLFNKSFADKIELEYLSIIERGFLYRKEDPFRMGWETINGVLCDHDVTSINNDVIIEKNTITYQGNKYIKIPTKSRQDLTLFAGSNAIASLRIKKLNILK